MKKMKQLKKMISVIVAAVMVFAMTLPVMAATNEPETGSITINPGENVALTETITKEDGTTETKTKSFSAYKVLDVKILENEKGFVYTVPKELRDFYSGKYDIAQTVEDFDYQVAQKVAEEVEQDKADNVFTFATDVLAAAKAANIEGKTGSIPEGETSYVISDLPLGYYVVQDNGEAKPVSALVLDTVGANQPINIKADKPSIDKKIDGATDEDDDTTGDVDTNKGYIGDKVPYKITSKVPDMTGYKKYYFVVEDTLSKGLTYNNDLVVTIGETPLTKVENASDPSTNVYMMTTTSNADGSTKIEIVFANFIQYKDQVGADIAINYSATVNQDAVIGEVGNENTVKLTYSNDPNKDYTGDPENPDKPGPTDPKGETPEKEVRTFVTAIRLEKVDENGDPLTGAKFELTGLAKRAVLINEELYVPATDGEFYRLKDGTYTKDEPVIANDETNTEDKYDSTTQKYKKIEQVTQETKDEVVSVEGYVDKDGILEFKGLSAGEYTITELLAPSGYNKLDAPLKVKIKYTAPTSGTTPCTWEVDSDYADNTKNNFEYDATNKIFKLKVTNRTGSQLPSTGGIGTTIFYIIGGILVVGAAILLVTKKRMGKEA